MSDDRNHPDRPAVEAEPSDRRPKFLFQSDDGRLFFVSTDAEETLRLHVGRLGQLREVRIQSSSLWHDNRSLAIATSEGILFSSSPEREAPPTWGDLMLERLDPLDFRINETESGAEISPA